MNYKATLSPGYIWLQNDMLTIYTKSNNDYKKTLNNYIIGRDKIIINTHTKPSFFKNGVIKLKCNTSTYVLVYEKKEHTTIDKIITLITNQTASDFKADLLQNSNEVAELNNINNQNKQSIQALRSEFINLLKNYSSIFEVQVQEDSEDDANFMYYTLSRRDNLTSKDNISLSAQMDLLEKLGHLRDKNYISEEEFKAKKKQILAL